MAQKGFGELIAAMVTPFREDGTVDFELAWKLALKLVEEGCDGVVVAGTTGESPTLTREEKLRLIAEVREALPETIMVWAGTGSYNTQDSVEMTRLAEATGADGVLAVTPYYNKPSQEGLYRHFKAVAESTGLPIMLYNVPGRTGVNLAPETVARLSEISNIVALKEASGNLDQVSHLLRLKPEFLVYSGDDSLTLPMLSIGAQGVVSVACHLVGREMKEMIRAYKEGNVAKAREIHARLWPLFKVLFITSNPVPVKAALRCVGFPAGPLRPPLCDPSERELQEIKKVLGELGLLCKE
ncbi:MAG: 4-hydroxy-tetrahydrodipicolinate synthase [Firmicutes bacterium]|nr:4-hydroxy-tetrahydrodipicolinate synthase [Candidatus Fermentithermobacillaceae bacterium]